MNLSAVMASVRSSTIRNMCSSTLSPKNINNFNRIYIAYKVEYSRSILNKATLDNLFWPMVILNYVFTRPKQEKDLSELQLVA